MATGEPLGGRSAGFRESSAAAHKAAENNATKSREDRFFNMFFIADFIHGK
jgi:hypothetical protein